MVTKSYHVIIYYDSVDLLESTIRVLNYKKLSSICKNINKIHSLIKEQYPSLQVWQLNYGYTPSSIKKL